MYTKGTKMFDVIGRIVVTVAIVFSIIGGIVFACNKAEQLQEADKIECRNKLVNYQKEHPPKGWPGDTVIWKIYGAPVNIVEIHTHLPNRCGEYVGYVYSVEYKDKNGHYSTAELKDSQIK